MRAFPLHPTLPACKKSTWVLHYPTSKLEESSIQKYKQFYIITLLKYKGTQLHIDVSGGFHHNAHMTFGMPFIKRKEMSDEDVLSVVLYTWCHRVQLTTYNPTINRTLPGLFSPLFNTQRLQEHKILTRVGKTILE